MIDTRTSIFVAGHNGMVGSAVVRTLRQAGFGDIVTASRQELDLTDWQAVSAFFGSRRIGAVVDAAAKVGGILANDSLPYDFLMNNLLIQNNLVRAALAHRVGKFVFLGSSCIYPKLAPQPMKEEHLLSGPLEPTNQWYAIAKIAGVMACRAARKQHGLDAVSLMPTNLYGPNDNFDLTSSHVLPAMIRKFHEARHAGHADVTLWGSGTPFREFLHVDDLAAAVVFALRHDLADDLYNVGYGSDVTIKDLALLVQRTVGHEGAIRWDTAKPDGTPRKLMDSGRFMALGWRPTITLEAGLADTYAWFQENRDRVRQLA
jgi:GDP-L-fucose synthase